MIQNCHELDHVKRFVIKIDSHLSFDLSSAQSIMAKFKEWVFAILILMSETINSLERSRRFYIFPKTAPTRVQVNDLHNYSIIQLFILHLKI